MRLFGLFALVIAGASCGSELRQSQSPMLLVVDSLTSQGGSTTLQSDVVKLVTTPAPCSTTSPCPTISSDSVTVTLSSVAKNLNFPTTSNNQITITRYHVDFVRADGRNTPGVDVPYGFDGAVAATIPPNGSNAFGFELVRHTAKSEPPLAQLQKNFPIIHAIARVTFYGHDLAGNDISATGSMSVDFGDFGDQ